MQMSVKVFLTVILFSMSFSIYAQVESIGTVRKLSDKEKTSPKMDISDRMRGSIKTSETHDADLSYMKQIYRRLDLEKGPNAALYYPEDVIEGQENLFRIIFRLVVDGNIPAYEYLDGREIFTDQYKVHIEDVLSRFDIYAREAKGSTERTPKYVVEEADVPASQVLNYYIIEKWEFDRRSSSMKTVVEAICPVLNRYGDYGEEIRYPMFWIKMEALRPYLLQQYVSVSDDNNLPQYTLDDFFSLNLYDGEIYKTRNLRNLSMTQMYPDEDDRQRAQDSIDFHLKNYGKDLWVPTREEYLSKKEAEKNEEKTVVSSDEIVEKRTSGNTSSSSRAKKKSNKAKKAKIISSSSYTEPEKSVRRRKK